MRLSSGASATSPPRSRWPLPSRLICDLLGVPRADQAWVIGQALIAYGRDDPEYVPGVLEDPGRGALAILDAAQQLAGYAQELSHGSAAAPAMT